MAERSPLFLGLVRPPKLLGLPIMYAMVWLFGSVLFLDVMVTALQETPPTRNRGVHGGDSYAP